MFALGKRSSSTCRRSCATGCTQPVRQQNARSNFLDSNSALWLATIFAAILTLSTHAAAALSADLSGDAAVTLAGSWAGTWTDSRKEYSSSGGSFTCVAADKETGV